MRCLQSNSNALFLFSGRFSVEEHASAYIDYPNYFTGTVFK